MAISETSSAGLAIDARHLKTGIGAYTKNLIVSLNELNYGPVHVFTRSEFQRELAPYCDRVSLVNAPIYSISEQVSVPFSARGTKMLHVPHYNVPLLYQRHLLVTVHDLTHIVFGEYRRSWKSRLYASPMLHVAVRKAAHIFTVSKYSKRRLVETLGISEDKVTVVYNGIGSHLFPGDKGNAQAIVRQQHGLSRPYLIYVGSLKPHKNIPTLLRAYANCVKRGMADIDLVIVGNGECGPELLHLARQLKIRPHLLTTATDAQLADLYRAAEILVLPSFEEGFGLPIIEAMASGIPVICANAAALPEIAGQAALLFDPADVEDLSRALTHIISSSDLRKSLRASGLIRAKEFSWHRTAEKHIPVYERFCGS